MERWQPLPQERQTETEFKPAYHRPFKPTEVEEHTPAQKQHNLSVLRNFRIQAARKGKP